MTDITVVNNQKSFIFNDNGEVVPGAYTPCRSNSPTPPAPEISEELCKKYIKSQEERWYQRIWRPCLAFVYIAIVLFDFVIMPVYVEYHNKGIDLSKIQELDKLSPVSQVEAIKQINLGQRAWEPLTLVAGGLFHIAMGAILTGAAVTRGMEKTQTLKSDIDTILSNKPK
jgi:hypothetical protein